MLKKFISIIFMICLLLAITALSVSAAETPEMAEIKNAFSDNDNVIRVNSAVTADDSSATPPVFKTLETAVTYYNGLTSQDFYKIEVETNIIVAAPIHLNATGSKLVIVNKFPDTVIEVLNPGSFQIKGDVLFGISGFKIEDKSTQPYLFKVEGVKGIVFKDMDITGNADTAARAVIDLNYYYVTGEPCRNILIEDSTITSKRVNYGAIQIAASENVFIKDSKVANDGTTGTGVSMAIVIAPHNAGTGTTKGELPNKKITISDTESTANIPLVVSDVDTQKGNLELELDGSNLDCMGLADTNGGTITYYNSVANATTIDDVLTAGGVLVTLEDGEPKEFLYDPDNVTKANLDDVLKNLETLEILDLDGVETLVKKENEALLDANKKMFSLEADKMLTQDNLALDTLANLQSNVIKYFIKDEVGTPSTSITITGSDYNVDDVITVVARITFNEGTASEIELDIEIPILIVESGYVAPTTPISKSRTIYTDTNITLKKILEDFFGTDSPWVNESLWEIEDANGSVDFLGGNINSLGVGTLTIKPLDSTLFPATITLNITKKTTTPPTTVAPPTTTTPSTPTPPSTSTPSVSTGDNSKASGTVAQSGKSSSSTTTIAASNTPLATPEEKIVIITLNSSIIKENGKDVTYPGDYLAPFLENGNTMIPLRMVAEQFKYRVGWNEETRRITLTSTDGKAIVLYIDDSKIYDGNSAVIGELLDATNKPIAPFIRNNRTYLPFRALLEQVLGMPRDKITFNQATGEIKVIY